MAPLIAISAALFRSSAALSMSAAMSLSLARYTEKPGAMSHTPTFGYQIQVGFTGTLCRVVDRLGYVAAQCLLGHVLNRPRGEVDVQNGAERADRHGTRVATDLGSHPVGVEIRVACAEVRHRL